jgi:hypothetical protein
VVQQSPRNRHGERQCQGDYANRFPERQIGTNDRIFRSRRFENRIPRRLSLGIR